MVEERQGGRKPVNTIPEPIPGTDRSSKEESDVKEEVEETQHHQLDQDQKISDQTAHVCEICGKHFSSGKALGGHKRIHFQSSKRDSSKKNKRSRKSSAEGNNDDDIHSCSICGKNFGSVKALYGHLRLHPDRTRRGAGNQQASSSLRYESNPNPNPSSPIEPKLEGLDTTQMEKLPNYPRFILSVELSSSWTTDDPEQDTAGILLLLARENPLNDEKSKKRKFTDINEKKKLTELLPRNGGDDEIRVSSSSSRSSSEEKKKKKKKKKKVYTCSSCNKSFSSHQAYGGHVSSHNKSGNSKSSCPTMESTQHSTSRSEVGPSNESQLDVPRQSRVLDIDLNELPPSEDEDEAQFRNYP